ncbi:DUF6351 family protein [Xenophilus azovorans]|uniref:DUF6351 family protein n=1 Tax=Xenophilus azovorans TaxID=151755 RepID=UPI00068B96E7|nr:DUF6351 family protein [Xenophilus azovorans]
MRTLSSREDMASGGDAVIEVKVPGGTAKTSVKLNGIDITSSLVADQPDRLRGRITGLAEGRNTLSAVDATTGAQRELQITNHPTHGPIFAGPHQVPWVCETEASGLGPSSDAHCTVAKRFDWFYYASDSTFKPLPSLSRPYPADLTQTTTIDGKVVDFIVRVESGTIDQSIYRIAIIDDPTKPISDPWSAQGKKPGAGWNGKLNLTYGGSCNVGYRSGRNNLTDILNMFPAGTEFGIDPLGLGFAVAFASRMTLGNGCDLVISAETSAMLKEYFVEQYGLPKFTIGTGGSGGSMQQHFIAQNYPGLLDAITATLSFPDLVSIIPDVTDCGLLTHYFNTAGANWPASRRSQVDGYLANAAGTATTCASWDKYAHQWVTPTTGFDPAVPASAIYNASTNPTGLRGGFTAGMVNVFGIDPNTGFARMVYDNVGVQYGLNALQRGTISVDEFLDINQNIGGLDVDGNYIPSRTSGDLEGIKNAYRSGVLSSGANMTLPVIDARVYTDDAIDIHTRIRTFSMIDRLVVTNGTAANQVNWITARKGASGYSGTTNLTRKALIAHNEWLERMYADSSAESYASKVIKNKPASLVDSCWEADGTEHHEPATRSASSVCNSLFPIYSTVRIEAGASVASDALKCQLKPVDIADYHVPFSQAQADRLRGIFAQGVCDWTKPGVGQEAAAGTWQRY